MRRYRKNTVAVVVTLALTAMGCSGELGDPGVIESQAEITRYEVDMARVAIFEGLDVGRSSIVTSVNQVLSENLLSPGFEAGVPLTDPEFDTGSCPYLAPTTGDSTLNCRFIVERARDLAYADMTPQLDRGPVSAELADFEDPEFIGFWYQSAAFSGVDGEVVRAVRQLRDLGACDTAPTPAENSEMAGQEVGRTLFLDRLAAQIAVTPETECDFENGVIRPARNAAEAAIAQTLASTPLCPDFAPVDAAVVFDFDRAKLAYELGVKAGIRDQAVLSAQAMLNTWECTPPPPPGGGDGGGGGMGDPLVVDLAGDGVAPIRGAVEFDLGGTGVAGQVAWPRGDDALLAIDLDESGTIDSGRELFSNYMVGPGDARFADGFAALAIYDRAELGGDQDGDLDAADAVFARLLVWRDDNRNGISEPGELSDLAAAGIDRFDLAPTTDRVRHGDAVMTARSGNLAELWLELAY